MQKLVQYYCELPTTFRRPLWQLWHKLILKFDKNREATFMNYGFQSLNGDEKLDLQLPRDEENRYCIQLYHHVASQVSQEGKDILEVGSGRGGGAEFLTRYLKPKSYTGIDISSSVIAFCNKTHNQPGLLFKKGFAEKLEFPDQSFDSVVNVESARCYADIQGFFKEVHRVLRPGGNFLFADMVVKGEIDEIREKINRSGLKIVEEKNISQNVVKALDLDHNRRNKMVNSFVPKFLRKSFLQFAGAKGSERYDSFATGRIEYWSFLLSKN
jgi:ubiquinone/menaquinone biosynthesis C-methylase UbiE